MTTEDINNIDDGILQKSCITDRPVASEKDDRLTSIDYARALSTFIKNADTPVTIGIQGGWGSGKTSLISVLQEQLNTDETHPAVCVVVNAWEHSLFQEADNKAQVALSLLNGLAAGLKQSVKQCKWLDAATHEIVSEQNAKVETAISYMKSILGFAGRVSAQMISNALGTGDVSAAYKDKTNDNKEADIVPPLAESVHNLRNGLEMMVKNIKYNGKQVKVVFFIDDLDRVSPPTAIEILDITKNIFDVPNCIFVLAIDYEVVVKGLEAKYGKRSPENEREFRQYFDKIIQIPFTMPLGAYSKNLDNMLKPALERLNYTGLNIDLLKRLAKDAQLATGGIPRSIKRIVNTLSLLRHIDKERIKKSDAKSEEYENLEAHFIIIALHVSFPEICRRLMEKPDFPKWNIKQLDLPWKLEAEKQTADLEALMDDQLFNDEWEKVVYCLCAQTPWLKTQASSVSRLLNNLLQALDNDYGDPKELTEDGRAVLIDIIESIRVVAIDTETQNVAEFNDKSVKADRVTKFFQKLQDVLAEKLPHGVMPFVSPDDYAKSGATREYEGSMSDDAAFVFEYTKKEELLEVSFWGGYSQYNKKEILEIIKKSNTNFGYDARPQQKQFYLYFGETVYWNDLIDSKNGINVTKLMPIADKACKMYEDFTKINKTINR